MDTRIYHPVSPATVTEEAGTRGGTHMGRDYAAKRGQAVYAPVSGTVIYAGGDGASGKLPGTNIVANGQALVVRIRRADGFIVHVAHMDFMSVKVGQEVIGGQTIIGGAGDTGWSTGVHVHVEYRWDLSWNGGRWVDPRDLALILPDGSAGNSSNASPQAGDEEEADMANHYIAVTKPGKQINAIFNPVSGFFHEFESADGEYNTNILRTFGVTAPSSIVGQSHYDAVKRDCAAVRAGK